MRKVYRDESADESEYDPRADNARTKSSYERKKAKKPIAPQQPGIVDNAKKQFVRLMTGCLGGATGADESIAEMINADEIDALNQQLEVHHLEEQEKEREEREREEEEQRKREEEKKVPLLIDVHETHKALLRRVGLPGKDLEQHPHCVSEARMRHVMPKKVGSALFFSNIGALPPMRDSKQENYVKCGLLTAGKATEFMSKLGSRRYLAYHEVPEIKDGALPLFPQLFVCFIDLRTDDHIVRHSAVRIEMAGEGVGFESVYQTGRRRYSLKTKTIKDMCTTQEKLLCNSVERLMIDGGVPAEIDEME